MLNSWDYWCTAPSLALLLSLDFKKAVTEWEKVEGLAVKPREFYKSMKSLQG
jgi:hypothetical protein